MAPGLLGIRWAERRQVMVDYFRSAPALLEDVRQKQADYEAMESSGSFGDFTAWLAGQITGGWKSPETYAGGSSKVASLLGRALWTGLKQAGIAAGSDAVVQWLLVKAGLQKEFNPVQTVTTAITAGAFNAAGKAGADTVKLGISAKSGAPGGKAPAANAPNHPSAPVAPTPNAPAPQPAARRLIDVWTEEHLDGPHAIHKHVAKTDKCLLDRLTSTSWMKAASTYRSLAEANTVTQMVVDANAAVIDKWLANTKLLKHDIKTVTPVTSANLQPIGLVLERGSSELKLGNGAKVVLERDATRPNGFKVITSFPIFEMGP